MGDMAARRRRREGSERSPSAARWLLRASSCAVVLLCLFSPGAQGKGVYVHPTEGSDTEACGLSLQKMCRTLGAAYNRTDDGDTVFLGPGVYRNERDRNVGDLVGGSRAFTRSQVYVVPLHEGQSGWTKPVIDLGYSGLLFDFKGASDVTLRNIIIARGSGRHINRTQTEGGS